MSEQQRGMGGGAVVRVDDADLTVLFERDHVCVHRSSDVGDEVPGKLCVYRKESAAGMADADDTLFLCWMPTSLLLASMDTPEEGAEAAEDDAQSRDSMYAIKVPLREVHCVHRIIPRWGWHSIVLVLHSGISFAPLHFHMGGVREFFHALKEHVSVTKSAENPNIFFINDTSSALQRSLTLLDLRPRLARPRASTAPPSMHLDPTANTRAPSMQSPPAPPVQRATPTPGDAAARAAAPPPLPPRPVRPLGMFEENVSAVVKDVSWALVGLGNKVTRFAKDVVQSVEGSSPTQQGATTTTTTTTTAQQQSRSSVTRLAQRLLRSSTTNVMSGASGVPHDTTHMQHVQTRVGSFTFLDDEVVERQQHAALRKDGVDETANVPQRREELSQGEWLAMLDEEGRVRDVAELRRIVFYGGVCEELRRVVWPFLLGYFPYDSTHAQRVRIREGKAAEYAAYKRQWTSITEAQEARFGKFRERRSRIEKDVMRTDRTAPLFRAADSPHSKVLHDVLLTYAFYNFDIGYCQGMSDLVSPIYAVMQDEVDTFWCFSAFMDSGVEANFFKDQSGMHTQLSHMAQLVKVLDRSLYNYLERNDSLNFFYCFRWVLIWFKREFSFQEIMRLWEVLWTRYHGTNFVLFVALAVLERHKAPIFAEEMGFDEILKHINDLSGHIDMVAALTEGEILLNRYIAATTAQ